MKKEPVGTISSAIAKIEGDPLFDGQKQHERGMERIAVWIMM
jgi:hypothetical protein